MQSMSIQITAERQKIDFMKIEGDNENQMIWKILTWGKMCLLCTGQYYKTD
jgi:hypothetical protein